MIYETIRYLVWRYWAQALIPIWVAIVALSIMYGSLPIIGSTSIVGAYCCIWANVCSWRKAYHVKQYWIERQNWQSKAHEREYNKLRDKADKLYELNQAKHHKQQVAKIIEARKAQKGELSFEVDNVSLHES